jgi:hypothetical protein
VYTNEKGIGTFKGCPKREYRGNQKKNALLRLKKELEEDECHGRKPV